jgi:hypothetical protein
LRENGAKGGTLGRAMIGHGKRGICPRWNMGLLTFHRAGTARVRCRRTPKELWG